MKKLLTIRNFVQLRENIGTSGQPTAAQFKPIADEGYKAVINLAMPDHAESISSEGEIVSSLGMTYIHLPVPFDNPDIDHVQQFIAIVDALKDSKIWIHCIMNYRVSAFMYLYLTQVLGLDDDQARSPMFDKWKPDKTWMDLLGWHELDIE